MTDELYFPLHVNWELLKRFNIVANSYSFQEAARKVGTSSSALLGQMDQLEKELTYPLFKRVNRNRSKVLTPDGEMLKVATENMFEFLSKPLQEMVNQGEAGKAQILRIITTEGLATSLLYEPIKNFMASHPDVKLELMTKTSPEMIEPGEVWIRSNFMEQRHVKREFLFSHHLKMYASKDYVKKYGKPNRQYELANHKILYYSTQGGATAKDRWREEYNVLTTPDITSDSIDFLVRQCVDGAGILEVADLFTDQGELVEMLPKIQRDRIDIYIAYNKKSGHEQLIPDFVDYLQEVLGED